jgi:hypothetical protein
MKWLVGIVGFLLGCALAVLVVRMSGAFDQVWGAGVRHGKASATEYFLSRLDSLAAAKRDTIKVVTVRDSVHFVEKPVHDTLWVADPDSGVFVESVTVTRTLKTKADDDSVTLGRLYVQYLLPPVDLMTVDFDPAPWETLKITETKYVMVDRKSRWFEKPWFCVAGGILGGAAVVAAVK